MTDGTYTKPIISKYNILVSQNADSSKMWIIYMPFYFWDMLGAVAIIGAWIWLLLSFRGTQFYEAAPLILILLFATFIFLIFSVGKRKISSHFDVVSRTLKINRGGVYSTGIDSNKWVIPAPEVLRVGIRRYIRRMGDGFEVFLVLNSKAAISITGTDLTFPESHLCAETIRDFLNIKDKIDAID